jgi:uncharacterized protein YggE
MNRVRIGQTVALALLLALGGALVTLLLLNSRPVAGAAVPPPQLAAAVGGNANTLTVVGQGSAAATPDQATVTIGVAATRGSVPDAIAAAGADLANLLKALHAEGVQDKDIQTAAITIGQESNCCPRVVTGYNASTQLNVLVHHVANLNSLVAAAVSAVGNDVQLNGIALSLSDTAAKAKAARASAMADAAVRANQWAALAGRHLGGIVSVSEAPSPPQFGGCGGCGAGGGGGIAVMAGQTTVSLTITVVYELLA